MDTQQTAWDVAPIDDATNNSSDDVGRLVGFSVGFAVMGADVGV